MSKRTLTGRPGPTPLGVWLMAAVASTLVLAAGIPDQKPSGPASGTAGKPATSATTAAKTPASPAARPVAPAPLDHRFSGQAVGADMKPVAGAVATMVLTPPE